MTTAVTTAIILCAAFAAFMYFRRKRVVILQPHLTFPDDENGDVLRLMQANGDDLDAPRDINFAFLFETQSEAERFAAVVAAPNFLVEVLPGLERKSWGVEVTHFMLPAHAAITELETRLSKIAAEFGGEPDGWGSFGQPARSWDISNHTYEDFPLLLRWPTNVDTRANRERYPRLAIVSHEFTHRHPDGRPESEYNLTLFDFDRAITSAFDSPPRGVPLLVETFGGFRHYYFCVAPDIDLASIIQPVARRFPSEKLTWKYSAKPAWDFLRWYAKQYSTAISPPVSFQT